MSSSLSSLGGRLFRVNSSSSTSFDAVRDELTLEEFLEEHVAHKRIVLVGEYHGAKPIVRLLGRIQAQMTKQLMDSDNDNNQSSSGFARLHILLEHFSMDMTNTLLRPYQQQDRPFSPPPTTNATTTTTPSPTATTRRRSIVPLQRLFQAYYETGHEGHNLLPYIPLLEAARHAYPRVLLHGAFLPREHARQWMKATSSSDPNNNTENDNNDDSVREEALRRIKQAGYLAPYETLRGTAAHYQFFGSLLTGQSVFPTTNDKKKEDPLLFSRHANPSTPWALFFEAQLLKDASMAWCLEQLLESSQKQQQQQKSQDRFLLVCGVGHMLFGHGVPERVYACLQRRREGEDMPPESQVLRIACLPYDENQVPLGNGRNDKNKTDLDATAVQTLLTRAYSSPMTDAADVCFLYPVAATPLEQPHQQDTTHVLTREYSRNQCSSLGPAIELKKTRIKTTIYIANSYKYYVRPLKIQEHL